MLILAQARAVVLAFGLLCVGLFPGAAALAAGSPDQDLQAANVIVQRSLTAARTGDIATARQAYDQFENTWFDIEDGIRAVSREQYVAIEKAMTSVNVAFSANPPDQNQVVGALQSLDAENQRFIQSATPKQPTRPASNAASTQAPSIQTLLDQLSDAQAALAKNDFDTATARLKAFESTWLDVEGQVKTRSADDYRQTENDMALASSLASQSSPQTATVIGRMATRLEPYRQSQQYGVVDAAIILLREGLEALLVIAALSAVLNKSGSRAGQAWLWSGAVGGLALSVVLGLAIQAFFGAIINPANRELMEGVIGLVAAAMLIYVSYWLHTKASISGWQKYINEQTRDALKGGRLVGIAVLAFLAVFREGAETALFYLGMVSNISNTDLLLGLGIGFAALVVLGFLMVVVGLRIPMRPFFTVASVLVFYLCFKFIGTGIHALQVSGHIPTGSAGFLPAIDFVGLYPTWPTTIAQILLLGAAAWVLLRDRLNRPARAGAALSMGALLVVGMACTASTPAASPTAAQANQTSTAGVSAAPASATPATQAKPVSQLPFSPAPVLTSARKEATLVSGPRKQLEQAALAVQKGNFGAARAAMEAYDAEWNGIEVYVNFRSRELYGEIETHYQADITNALKEPQPDAARLLPMVQAMIGKYDEAIRLSDTGAPLSPLFDDLATLRTVRAPLRVVSPALKAGDTAKATAGFAEFKSRWPQAQPLLASRSPEALQQMTDALAQADKAMTSPTSDSTAAIDALMTAYNVGVNALSTAAREASFQK